MNQNPHPFRTLFLTGLLLCVAAVSSMADEMAASFAIPPSEAKPRIWWYWGESVTTEHGITQDIEALKRVGFGGVILYEQVFSDAPDALKSLSPEFMARVRFAAAECARLGLTLEVNAGPGYVAGGPWITPELGMQKLVFSETQIEGGKVFSGKLPQPESHQDFYRDVAVLAYLSPAGSEIPPKPALTSEPAGLDLATMFGSSGKKVSIPPAPNGRPTLIQLDYGRPFTARSFSYSQKPTGKALIRATQLPGNWRDDAYGQGVHYYPPIGKLEASNDGIHWDVVCEIPYLAAKLDRQDRQTLAFQAKTAPLFPFESADGGR